MDNHINSPDNITNIQHFQSQLKTGSNLADYHYIQGQGWQCADMGSSILESGATSLP